ncbi:MAG: uncharacterized protein JWQ35_957 [Bacteriovoracaceae bacterium]|nr:uncharacterized protein [Bacteriovoracaceae bacterium]
MTKKVNPIPEGSNTLTPYLTVKAAGEAIEFYKKVLDGKELFRMNGPGGKIMHAQVQLGSSRIMLADEFPEMSRSPESYGGSPVSLYLYVENVDEIFSKAIAAGAKEVKPLRDEFYGDRSGAFRDPFGHIWTVATHIEDVSREEMEKRVAELFCPS